MDVSGGEDCQDAIHYHEDPASDNEEHADQCSPFCSCQCCQILTTIEFTEHVELISLEARPSKSFINFPSRVVFSIWDPPKMG